MRYQPGWVHALEFCAEPMLFPTCQQVG